MNIFKYLDLGYCEIFIFEHYIVKQVREGRAVKPEETALFMDLVNQYFPDRPFVYLSNRTFSYSVNPIVYMQVENIPQMSGIGIIARDKIGKFNAHFERHFYNKPFHVFDNFRDAVDWADDLIRSISKKIPEKDSH